MAVFKTYKFKDIAGMQLHLQGAVFSGKGPNTLIQGLATKTLIFTKPAAKTVTFAAVAGQGNDLYLKDVRTQIEATAGLGVKLYLTDYGFYLIESTVANGVSITGGTGRALLGFDPNNNVTNVPYNYPDGAAPAVVPYFVSAYFDQSSGSHVLITRE